MGSGFHKPLSYGSCPFIATMFLISDRPGEGAIILRGLRVYLTLEEVVAAVAVKLIERWKYSQSTWRTNALLEECFEWDGPKIYEVFSDKNPKKLNKEVTRPLVIAKAKEILKETSNVPNI